VGVPNDSPRVNGQIVNEAGSVYLFTRVEGRWEPRGKLVASDAEAHDDFGYSVAMTADTIVVGAPNTRNLVNGRPIAGAGSAYVFVLTGTTWAQQAILRGNEEASSQFGHAVAISGNSIAVGQPNDVVDAPTRGPGRAYVFVRSGNVWLRQWSDSIAVNGLAGFGFSIAINVQDNPPLAERTYLVVGYPQENGGVGAAYVFTRNGSEWSAPVRLVATDRANGDSFGQSLAVSGETVLIGAPTDDIGSNLDQGSAYLFTRNFATWVAGPKLVANNGGVRSYFGQSVALNSTTAIVGRIGGGTLGKDPGAAYVFTRENAAWTQTQIVQPPDSSESDEFGAGVAISGETLLVGAPHQAVNNRLAQGAAYFYLAPKALAVTSAASYALAVAPDSIAASFGTALATTTELAATVPLPTTLAGTSVRVRDREGLEKVAQLFFVSPTQINFLIPAGLAGGPASVLVTNSNASSLSLSNITLSSGAPGLFSANADGRGIASGLALRVRADGSLAYEDMVRFDFVQDRFVGVPISVGNANEQVFLVLFGTGLRGSGNIVRATVGGKVAEVLYAGPQGGFAGLDQVNLRLDRDLGGRGTLDIVLTVASANPLIRDVTSNTVNVTVRN
jgi:uncharacterized protein (TIGR03437 family)